MKRLLSIGALATTVACLTLLLTVNASAQTSTDTTKTRVKQEILRIDWPAEYKWKVGSDQDDGKMHMLEVVPGNETVENWTIIGSLLAIKGVTGVPMDVVLKGTVEQQQKLDTAATVTLIERNDTAAHPWILFKIESPTAHNAGKPESELFYFIQGNTSLFNGIVGIKEATLTNDFVAKWKGVFKTSRLALE
jgi:hypothetical protein